MLNLHSANHTENTASMPCIYEVIIMIRNIKEYLPWEDVCVELYFVAFRDEGINYVRCTGPDLSRSANHL